MNAPVAHMHAMHFPHATTKKGIITVGVTMVTLEMVQHAWVSSSKRLN